MNGTRSGKRKAKKVTPFKRFLRFFLVFVLLVGISGLAYAAYTAWNIQRVANESYSALKRGDKSELRDKQVTLKKDPVTILLMGVDDYVPGDKGRTDTLMLLAVNPKTKEIGMVSIPRDTRTYIPDRGKYDKINSAYPFGNEEGTVEAVQHFLDVPVDYYIKTGVSGFQDVVDELGGIDVNVPFDFKQVDLKNRYVRFKKGPAHLDGRAALAFVQMRKEDPRGDFGREDRQQTAIRALADKAVSLDTLTKANQIIETAGKTIKTNIQLDEFLGFRNFYDELKNKKFTRFQIKGSDEYINRIYYFKPDPASVQNVRDEFRRILEIDQTNSSDQNNQSSDNSNNQ